MKPTVLPEAGTPRNSPSWVPVQVWRASHQVALGEHEFDLVLQVGEGAEEIVDGLPLTFAATPLAVVDEILGQQSVADAGVPGVDRLGVEASDQVLVLAGHERGAYLSWAGWKRWAMACGRIGSLLPNGKGASP